MLSSLIIVADFLFLQIWEKRRSGDSRNARTCRLDFRTQKGTRGAISTMTLWRHRALLRGRERRNLKNLAKKARPMNARRWTGRKVRRVYTRFWPQETERRMGRREARGEERENSPSREEKEEEEERLRQRSGADPTYVHELEDSRVWFLLFAFFLSAAGIRALAGPTRWGAFSAPRNMR